MRIMHIVGNRPQFIKLAILFPALARSGVSEIIVHTGQHFDSNMSSVFFKELAIPEPNYDLGINQIPHNEMIGRMIIETDRVIVKERPHLIVVYGDTNSTLAGAIAAKKRGVRIAHIEAGIRTGDGLMPEESNRYLVDRMADLNFCCTYQGMKNLEMEGFLNGLIKSKFFLSGDLMLDAVKIFGAKAKYNSKLEQDSRIQKPFILATIHREENNEDPENLQNIADALNKLHKHTTVLMPLHPKTKKMIEKFQLSLKIETCDPLGYFDMQHVLQKSQSVITDSGGLSREAFFLQKPTLVLMQHPFWPEIFIHGNCLQSNPKTSEILSRHAELMNSRKPFNVDIFGTGSAAVEISRILLVAIKN
ncbi:MAG: non-hydrolyzing UDP-N-acetylglucosamine 2-epimerase [Chitinophagales bacterium]